MRSAIEKKTEKQFPGLFYIWIYWNPESWVRDVARNVSTGVNLT
jgi:hypothetical protein